MYQRFVKIFFDFCIALILILLLAPVMVFFFLILYFFLPDSPIFTQARIGRHGKVFKIYKFCTIPTETVNPQRLSFLHFLRASKLDEMPQLINVLKGDMSIVGPRPDVQGYYDTLKGEDRKVLQLKPGLTSLAALKYIDEEELLNQVADRETYNDTVIFPDKVQSNLNYYYNQSFWLDLKIIGRTIRAILIKR